MTHPNGFVSQLVPKTKQVGCVSFAATRRQPKQGSPENDMVFQLRSNPINRLHRPPPVLDEWGFGGCIRPGKLPFASMSVYSYLSVLVLKGIAFTTRHTSAFLPVDFSKCKELCPKSSNQQLPPFVQFVSPLLVWKGTHHYWKFFFLGPYPNGRLEAPSLLLLEFQGYGKSVLSPPFSWGGSSFC